MKATGPNTNAIWSQLQCWLDIKDVKRPTNVQDAETWAEVVKDLWTSNGRRHLVAAYQSRCNIVNELMRLRQTGGSDHEMACAFVAKLETCASKDLKRHDLFGEVMSVMSRAVAPKEGRTVQTVA